MGDVSGLFSCCFYSFSRSENLKIMAVFNWNYLSFVNFDSTWVYREMVLIPILIVILWFVWMKFVRSALKDALNTTRAMSVDEAYANLSSMMPSQLTMKLMKEQLKGQPHPPSLT